MAETDDMSLEELSKTGMAKLLTPFDKTKEGLSIMTNDGNWVPRYKQFDHRIMLRAVLSEK